MTNRILQILGALLIPIVALYFSSTRQLSIGWNFIQYIFSESIYLISFILLFIFTFLLLKKKINIFDRIYKYILYSFTTYKSAWLISLFIVSASFAPYLKSKYKIYSEVSFQQRVLKEIDNENYKRARSLCESYITLYPQRKKGNMMSDDICIPYLDYYRKMIKINNFLRGYQANKEEIDEMKIPVDWNAKRYGIYLTDKWKGNERYSDRLSTDHIPIERPFNLVQWGEKNIKIDNPNNKPNKDINRKVVSSVAVEKPSPCLYDIQVASYKNFENAKSMSLKINSIINKEVKLVPISIDSNVYTRVVIPCIKSDEDLQNIIQSANLKDAIIKDAR